MFLCLIPESLIEHKVPKTNVYPLQRKGDGAQNFIATSGSEIKTLLTGNLLMGLKRLKASGIVGPLKKK